MQSKAEIGKFTLDVLSRLIAPGAHVALVDYPHYFNAGDALIYRGTLSYLRELRAHVDYVCSPYNYDSALLRRQVPEGPILLQGGGNFGDRWPLHQLFREQVLTDFPDRMVVQMPQSIDFSDPVSLERARSSYEKHGNVTLLARDRGGFDRMERDFPACRIEFCPDVAFGVVDLLPVGKATLDIAMVVRQDVEAASDPADFDAADLAIERADWHLGVAGNLGWWSRSIAEAALFRGSAVKDRIYPSVRRSMDARAELNISAAVRRLSRGRVVVTDRLHAAVLSVLLDKPVVMVDNVTGKVSAIHRDYLGALPDVHIAAGFAEAGPIALELASKSH
ncbi:polysaccharide pyruvyl transferase family protein [Williamsia sp. 1135]|uniref:polysaccharide pyruvyl transferase family protein n=1 Tax=Williamsia sp. 1135 TaxID=1889262 RepID=UPI000A0FE9E3|nr:polysaccharide pyruvyl transferase family protein [Williamsia sp. 1135]ORM24998.1 hypothetical protein BFL43_24875 [Williamsia sp. 1135]